MTDPDLLALLAADRPERLLHVRRLPARAGRTAAWPDWAPPDAVAAWAQQGIARPWQHQVDAAEHAVAGRHVVLATGTASGKSMAFALPALAAIRAGADAPDGRGATALYLSPTKALAADQERTLAALGLPWLRAATYDGDTPTEERAWVRRHANYVLTNPDLLHHGLLPGHEAWAGFLRHLRLVVVDELHSYRGVFGAHVAAVVRRLRRLAEHYGASPVVFTASATTANPEEAAARLVGDRVVAVTDDASPRPATAIAFWEPGLLADGRTPRSALAESADLLAGVVRAGAQGVAFVRSRRGVEVVAELARGDLDDEPVLASQVAAYRGGYLPEERRALETGLRSGRIRGLATTSALELGIDVSGLDAVVVTGWPGTRASLWQQFGRAGRLSAPALGVLVAREDPLDHYVTHHPESVLDAPVEASVFDPDNPYVLAPHLAAAAAELPVTGEAAARWFGPAATTVLDQLTVDGLLRRRRTGWYWTRPDRASDLADLRGSGAVVRIVEEGTGRVLGTVDGVRAASTVHPGAVYVHQGVEHVVVRLDLDDAVAWARVEEVDYWTQARSISDLRIRATRAARAGSLFLGEVEVSSQVVSFSRRAVDGTMLGEEPLDLPPQQLVTQAVWWTLDDATLSATGLAEADLPGAAHAAEHASIGLLPLFATCDRWDLGGVSTARHPDTGHLTVFVYDGAPGGAGFAERGFTVAQEWLSATRALIADCGCSAGCPACVQSPKCGNQNSPLDKGGAVRLLDAILMPLAGRPAR